MGENLLMIGQVGLRLEVENYGGNNKRVQSRMVVAQEVLDRSGREGISMFVEVLVQQIMEELRKSHG